MITVKDGVDLSGIDRRMWNAVAVVAGVFYVQEEARELLVTSGREGEHGVASWHYKGRAIDFDWPRGRGFEDDTDEARSKRLALRKAVLDEVGSRFEGIAHKTHLHLELERG